MTAFCTHTQLRRETVNPFILAVTDPRQPLPYPHTTKNFPEKMSSVENLEFVEMSMEMVAKDQLLDAASSSSSEDDAGGNVSSSDSDKLHIGDKETKRVKNWRNILIVVLVLTAGAICAGTYLFVHDEVDNDYEISVRTGLARNVSSSIHAANAFLLHCPFFLVCFVWQFH